MADVKPIPDGYPAVIPALVVDGAGAAIEFYTGVFGFQVRMRMDMPDGKVGHAELTMGDSVVMLADEFPDMGYVGPRSIGGTPITMYLYVPDVDATFARAIAKGATEVREIADQFYGDRSGQLEDPFGHRWTLSTHVEDVPEDELARRAQEAVSQA